MEDVLMALLVLSPRITAEFADEFPPLADIVAFALRRYPRRVRYVRCTSARRTQAEENQIALTTGRQPSGIHMARPTRAVDLSIRDAIRPDIRLTSDEIQAISDRINARFEYDYKRPGKKVCYAAPHGTGPHFHLQVHPRTRVRR